MASRLPLWRRKAPRYPIYWQGNPQNRVFLPQFWMKLVKPKKDVPPDRVQFIVHPDCVFFRFFDIMTKKLAHGHAAIVFTDNHTGCPMFGKYNKMSKFDIKQYLEKIYSVPVLEVKTSMRQGDDIKHPRGHVMWKEDDEKIAYVQLGDNSTFKYPDILKGITTDSQKQMDDYKKAQRDIARGEQKYWDRLSLPPWFR